MGDETAVLEDLLPALFYMTLKPVWVTEPTELHLPVRGPKLLGVLDSSAGAKSRALVRVRQAEGIGQHHRNAN